MRAPHILDFAQHVGLVLLTRSMVVVLLVVTTTVTMGALIIITNVVQFWHHPSSACINILVSFEQRRVHLAILASIAATSSTFTCKSRCVTWIITRVYSLLPIISVKMRLQLLVPILILWPIVSILVCIYRRVSFDYIRCVLVVNLLEGVLVKIYWTLAMRSILINQLSLILDLRALGQSV